MDGTAACILLTLTAAVLGAWVYAIAANARLARRVDDLVREVLRLGRRVEDAERRAESARPAEAVPAASPVAPIAAEPPPIPPAPAAVATPREPIPWIVAVPDAVPDAVPRVPPPAPVAAPDILKGSPSDSPFDAPYEPPPEIHELRPATAAAPAPQSSGRPVAGSAEAFVGGRVLLFTGVIAVLFGLGLFLRYAIENDLIGRGARVAMGAAAGIAALAAGYRVQSRGLNVFGQALMGLGLGALYLCDYFASVRYGFYERPAAFAVAALVTAGGAILAVRREAPVLAWLGFLGAFLAPWLLGRNEDALEGLTLWLAVVDVGIAATLVFRAWRGLDVLGALGTMAYFLAWRSTHFRDERLGAAATCLALSIGVVLLMTFVPAALARRRIAPASFAGAFLTALIGYGAAYDLLFPDHRAAFGAVSIGFAVLLLGLAELHRSRAPDAAPDVESMRAFALAVVGAAVPLIFRGTGIAPAWSALGAACVYAGTRLRRDWLVVGGFAAISLAALNALAARADSGDAAASSVFSGAFVSALTPCIALVVGAWSLRRWKVDEGPAADVSMTAAAWGAVALLAQETWRAFAPAGSNDAAELHALLATTGVVAAFAVGVAALTRRREGLGTLPAWGPLAFVVAFGIAVLGARPERGFSPVGNERFVAGVIAVLALGAAAFVGPRPRDLPGVAAALYLFALVTSEIVAWDRRGGTPELSGAARDFRMHVALWLTWAAYGAACAAVGLRLRRTWLVVIGTFATLLAAADTLYARMTISGPVFGGGFLLAFIPLAGLLAATWFLRRDASRTAASPPDPAAAPTGAADMPAWCGVVHLFLLVTLELLAWGDRGDVTGTTREDLRFQAQVALSVVWAVYGAALVAAGFWRRVTGLRWAGICVLLLTVGKVFLVDLAQLSTAYRVGSFLVLGLLLVAASFLYQRLRKGDAPPDEST